MRFPTSTRLAPLLLVVALVAAACGGGDRPTLSAAAPAPTATADEPDLDPVAEEPTNDAGSVAAGDAGEPTAAAPTPTMQPTAVPTPTPIAFEPSTRGISDTTIRLGIVKTTSTFGDVETGVSARLRRLGSDTVGGRTIEITAVLDDEGIPEQTLDAVRRLVEEDEVFAIVLASASPSVEVTDYLADNQVPFFGWGFAPGFCAPNDWGFGFNGCLTGFVQGIDGATVNTSPATLVERYIGAPPTVVFVTTDDPPGVAASAVAAELWGDRLVGTILVDPNPAATIDTQAVLATIVDSGADVVSLSVGFERAIELKAPLIAGFGGMVLDDVTYLPGLLQDFSVADRLEGGFVFTQFPPQEEYRAVTAEVATDVDSVGGPLVYGQSITIGYWSTDLALAILDAVGPELDTATFYAAVHTDGVTYAPAADGAPCPISTLDIHEQPAGGGALLQVSGGIYQPVVEFSCPSS